MIANNSSHTNRRKIGLVLQKNPKLSDLEHLSDLEQFLERLLTQELALLHQLFDVTLLETRLRLLHRLLLLVAGSALRRLREVRVEAAQHARVVSARRTAPGEAVQQLVFNAHNVNSGTAVSLS